MTEALVFMGFRCRNRRVSLSQTPDGMYVVETSKGDEPYVEEARVSNRGLAVLVFDSYCRALRDGWVKEI